MHMVDVATAPRQLGLSGWILCHCHSYFNLFSLTTCETEQWQQPMQLELPVCWFIKVITSIRDVCGRGSQVAVLLYGCWIIFKLWGKTAPQFNGSPCAVMRHVAWQDVFPKTLRLISHCCVGGFSFQSKRVSLAEIWIGALPLVNAACRRFTFNIDFCWETLHKENNR